ncbi:MAG: SPOR domain-containing protein [Silicimonas sp.]|nr:SPOR domain-containing protein [Silicimonas sp.]NND43233.1 SPOR domain-containing protein [Silicimonas sp.]NNL34559.1 SPOR domain-containing protein [Silicimonas sp.]
MTFTSARTAAIVLVSAVTLAACEDFEGLSSSDTVQAEAAAQLGPDGPRTEIRDVDRPDVFNVTETALWDGRPSLGGIWVAHPDVTDPERVKVTNTKSGKTIEGALFRRERANPGPRIQLSSDAAAALGILAGQPTEVTIVAVRQEEIELAPEPLPIGEDSDAVDTSDAPATDDTAEVAVTAGATAVAAEAVKPAPKPKGFWGKFRDSLRNKPAGDVALAVDATEDATVPDVETQTLDPVTTAAAAAIDQAETTEETPAPAAAASALQNPYIQVGLFSLEENASAVAANLRQAGIIPEIRGQSSGDSKTLWRVYVGPMSTADDQAALLAQVKRLGYTDAFLAPN